MFNALLDGSGLTPPNDLTVSKDLTLPELLLYTAIAILAILIPFGIYKLIKKINEQTKQINYLVEKSKLTEESEKNDV